MDRKTVALIIIASSIIGAICGAGIGMLGNSLTNKLLAKKNQQPN